MSRDFVYQTIIANKIVFIQVLNDILFIKTGKYNFSTHIYNQESFYNGKCSTYNYILLSDLPKDFQSDIKQFSANSGKKVFLHRFLTFILGNRNFKGIEIHHIDFDSLNNMPENLIALTKNDHLLLHNDMKSKVKIIWEAPKNALADIKISGRKFNRIKRLYDVGFTYSEISKKIKTSKSTICKVLRAIKCTTKKKMSKTISKIKTAQTCITNKLQACYKSLFCTIDKSIIAYYWQVYYCILYTSKVVRNNIRDT